MTQTELDNLLDWGEYEHNISTMRGLRSLRKAPANQAFWSEWKHNKPTLQALGVTCKPSDDGWTVMQWTASTVAAPKTTSAPSVDPLAEPATDIATEVVHEEVAKVFNTNPEPITLGKDGIVWSAEQLAIYEWFAKGTGNLIVQARAGTGKTATIKQAFSHAPEAQMLYCVFNKKNQKEASEKIHDLRVDIKTLHSLGYSYILSVWKDVKPDNSVERDRIAEVYSGIPDEPAEAVERLVGFAKNTFINPSVAELEQLAIERDVFSAMESQEDGGWHTFKLASVAHDALRAAKTKDPLLRISFNDMVWLPVAQSWVRPRYDLVVVDEAQDMNLLQLVMARGACRRGGRICVVGDDRQAIYGFRGAASDGMGMMRTELNAASLSLSTTYRCPKAVVALAALLVPDYRAADTAPDGLVDECTLMELYERTKVGEAILSRLNAPLMSTCLKLLKKGTPARIEGRDIGKQLVGMVRKLKAKSVPDFLKRLVSWEERQVNRLDASKANEAKLQAIRDQRETLEAVAEDCKSIHEIEAKILSLFQDSDETQKPSVILSSVHKAKGLEWEHVYLLTATFSRKPKTSAEAQEEANIVYVARTRAKKHLTQVI